MNDHEELLVSRTASAVEIRRAYRELAAPAPLADLLRRGIRSFSRRNGERVPCGEGGAGTLSADAAAGGPLLAGRP